PSGIDSFVCATNPQELGGNPPYTDAPTQNKMPYIIKGHTYLLLVSHFTSINQSGYNLTFVNGSAVITDPGLPAFKSADIECDHQTIAIKLSKNIRCTSLAADGSDFSLSSGLASIVSATGVNCDNSFDMDSVLVKLSNPLPSGNYVINAKIGTDGNTLLDDCNNSVVEGDNKSFNIVPVPPTPLDSIVPLGCSPNSLLLVFSRPIQCSSIAADGSDFKITGPATVNIQSAFGDCNTDEQSPTIKINLASPITVGGTYQIHLAPGIDGNTIVDKCNLQTPAGSVLNFTAADTVSAQFSYQILFGCKTDSIQFLDAGGNGINNWQWTFDSTGQSSLQNPLHTYSQFGNKTVQLKVSNGVCSDSSSASIFLDNYLKASFTMDDNFCPEDKAAVVNNSVGNIISWFWDFGDGTNSTDSVPPPHSFPQTQNDVKYIVKLVVENNIGCYDTAMKQITKVRSCYIDVPSAFTPNGDSKNDYLYPLNAYKAIDLEFKVFNRYGQLVFETKDWTNKWDGTIGGKPQPTGTYVWMLKYTNSETGKKYSLKGTSVLIR
ncbi:MAG TPA: gliding motility-associated C-terminal domain-containing protein, partial [Puia sp.]|nr:gliding motility-associated C-terminal domain-containing protein [Puia sp.]